MPSPYCGQRHLRLGADRTRTPAPQGWLGALLPHSGRWRGGQALLLSKGGPAEVPVRPHWADVQGVWVMGPPPKGRSLSPKLGRFEQTLMIPQGKVNLA